MVLLQSIPYKSLVRDIFNIGVLLIFFVPDTSRPEFLVHELIACCHHQIHLQCHTMEQIVIVQARYIASGNPKTQTNSEIEIVEASKDKNMQEGFPEARKMARTIQTADSSSAMEQKDPNFMSLSDIDLHFLHEMDHKVKYKGLNDLSKLNTPEWARQIPKPRNYFPRIRRYTTMPPFHSQFGLNFTRHRLVDIPVSTLNFGESKTSVDRDTLWNQALFPVAKNSTNDSSQRNGRKTRYDSIVNENEPCYSYESVNDFIQLGRDKREVEKAKKKPQWHYKDLRTVFNYRCSGKPECTFNLLRNKLKDQEVTNVCHKWPDGRIVVKYICLNPTSGSVYTQCNQDISDNSKRGGGFILNPGYPRIYYGDEPCEWRITVRDGIRILLLLLDISMRPQENSVCRDKLVITENHTKKLTLCKESPSAIAIVTLSSSVNISLIPDSRFAYPKRGFLLYFRALVNCELNSLEPPLNSYIISHNASHALIRCIYGYHFSDLSTPERWILCDSISSFNQNSIYRSFSYSFTCEETNMTTWNSSYYTNGDEDTIVVTAKEEDAIYFASMRDIIIPVSVIGILFVINAIILIWIQRRKKRFSHEFENELNQGIEEGNLLQTSTENSTTSPTCSQGTTATASLLESKGNIDNDPTIQEYYYCPKTNKGIVTNAIDNGYYYSKIDGIPNFSTSHEVNNGIPSLNSPNQNNKYYYGQYFPRSTAV